jgi:hypothetical protein
MRNQDPSKMSSQLARVLSIRRIRLRTKLSSSTHENTTTSTNHSTNAPFTHSIWTPYSNQHQVCRIPYSTGRAQTFRSRTRALRSCFADSACGWKLCEAWHSSVGSKTLWVSHPTSYGRPIVTTLWTILPYRFDSSFIPFTRINNQRYPCHPDGFSSSQSEAYFHPTQQNLTVRVYNQQALIDSYRSR